MPSEQIPLIQGNKIGVEVDYRDALNVNYVTIPKEILGTKGYIRTHSGLKSFSEAAGKDRGAVYNERLGIHFRVSGNNLISVSETGVISYLGTVPGDGQVSLPYSFNTQAIIASGLYFLYDPVNGFRQVTDPDLGNPLDGTWIDGFYFFTDGETLFHTILNDESQIDPLDFATSEFSPDPTIAVARDFDNKAIAFNRYTIEYLDNTASENFAFSRIESRAKSVGIVGTHCKASIGGGWVIMGGRKEEQVTIYFITPSQTVKIATREIDLILSEYSEEQLSKAVIETREEDDLQLVLIRLENNTLLFNYTVYSKVSRLYNWSILRATILTDGTWPGANGVYDPRIAKWIYGDETESRLGELDRTIATIYDNDVEFIFFSPLLKLERASVDKMEFETAPGSTGGDSRIFLSATYDGVIYGQEYSVQYGTPNNRNERLIYRRLGYVRDFVGYKLRSVGKAVKTFARMVVDYG